MCFFGYVSKEMKKLILLEVIIHIHYTRYGLLFLLHNRYYHKGVSGGDKSIARERIVLCAIVGATSTIPYVDQMNYVVM